MSKCAMCKHSYTSKVHKTKCMGKVWKKRRPRASTRSSKPDMGRVLAPKSAPTASQSFYSDHSFEGEVIHSPAPSEVTA